MVLEATRAAQIKEGYVLVIEGDYDTSKGALANLYKAARSAKVPNELLISLLDNAVGLQNNNKSQSPPKPDPENPNKTDTKTKKEDEQEVTITYEDLLTLVKQLINKDESKCREIINGFGVNKITEIAKEDYLELSTQLKEALKDG